MNTQELLDRVETIRPALTADADHAEAQRMLTPAMYEAMYRAGLYAMLAPRQYGGFELHPAECMRVWEAVARIDAAAAWNLVMNQGIANYAAWLPEAGVKELFANGIPAIAGALSPPARAHALRGDGASPGRFRSAADATMPIGSQCLLWKTMPPRRLPRSSQRRLGQSWIPGTRWGCELPVRRIIARITFSSQII
jgi:alkylation response protein AidB-like acyl-CoA dehydrogenase